MSYITQQLDGFPLFGRFPAVFLIDPDLGPRQRLVYLALALHAKPDSGYVEISLDRIAEMLGYFVKGVPARDLVSRLISNPINPDTGKPRYPTGPGLVQLGYVKRHDQLGFDRVKPVTLTTPDYVDGRIIRPSEESVAPRLPASRKRSDYKAVKKAQVEEKLISTDPDVFKLGDEIYTRGDCELETSRFYFDDEPLTIPPIVYRYFKLEYPSTE